MFFLLGLPLWFLAIEIIFLIGIVTLVENEKGSAAGVVLAAFIAGVFFFTHTNPIDFILANGNNIFFIAVGYIVAGSIWSYLKWNFYLHSDAFDSKVKVSYSVWAKSFGRGDTTKTFSEWDADSPHNDITRNKVRITRWMIWWPVSLLWTILDDLVINIFNWIYEIFSSLFTRASKNRVNAIVAKLEEKNANTTKTV